MRRLIAAVLMLTLAAACNPFAPPPGQTPGQAGAEQTAATEAVRAVYAAYQSAQPDTTPDWSSARSAALSAAYTALPDLQMKSDDPVLDFDPIVGGQDWAISDLTFTEKDGGSPSLRIVTAKFKNAGEDREIMFDVVSDGGAWKVDNIRASAPWPYDVREIIAKAQGS